MQDLFHPQCDHLSSWPRLSISSEKLRWARSEDDAEPEQPRENKENNTQKGGKKGQWRCPKSVSARWDLHNNFHGRSLCLRERCMKWMPVWALESPWIPLLYLKPHGPNNGGLGQSPIPANVKKPCLWNLQFQWRSAVQIRKEYTYIYIMYTYNIYIYVYASCCWHAVR